MLALHYAIIFLMLYLIMFRLLEIPKKGKCWHLNTIVILVLLILELILGSYGIHHQFNIARNIPLYEFIYTVLASMMVLYLSRKLKWIPLVIVLNVFITVIATLGALAVFMILEWDPENLLTSPRYSLVGVIAALAMFMCLYPLVKFMKIHYVRLGIRGMLFLIVSLMGYGYYIASYFGSNSMNWDSIWTIFSLIGGAVPIIFIIAFVLKVGKLEESKQREMMLAQNYNLQKKHYLMLYEKEEETKKFRHDSKQQGNVVLALLRKGKIQESIAYLENMVGKLDAIDQKTGMKTGSDFVDASLNELLADDLYKDVKFNHNWTIPPHLIIEPMDMTSLFMNILSNAFEAAVKCPKAEQYVEVKIKALHDFLSINVRNSYDGVLRFKDDRFETTKSDKESHGYGSQIISEIVEKYKGQLETSFEDGRFNLVIIFEEGIYQKGD